LAVDQELFFSRVESPGEEHLLRDEEDWRRHMDYIHYNPVKHGYVQNPWDWPHSSFRQAVGEGLYSPGWGAVTPGTLSGMDLE